MKKKSILAAILFISSCSTRPVQFQTARKPLPSPTVVSSKSSGKKNVAQAHQLPTPTASIASVESVTTDKSNNSSNTALTSAISSATTTDLVLKEEPLLKQDTEKVETSELVSLLKNPKANKNKVLEAIAKETSSANIEKALEQTSATDSPARVYRPALLLKAGEISEKSHRPDLALQYFRSLTSEFPQSTQAIKANSEITLLQAAQEVDAKVVGAILPLTGKNSNIGQHALNSIRLGLGLNKPNSNLRLAIFDSQSSAELAIEGVEKLVRDDKVIAIIGGLSSKEALAAAQKSDSLGVPFIGLSQKSGLTSVGDYVFRNSLTAEMQVDRLVQYAFEKLNAKRFAVIYPNDAYGIEFANIYWDHVLARGGQMTAAQSFNAKENDFTSVIQKMVGTYYPEARPEEYRERLKEIELAKKEKLEKNKDKKQKNSRAHEVQENILPPVVDFDVLFIPDTGKTLGQVMAFMKVNDVPKMTYLGTNIWNTPDLSKRVGLHSNSILFVDAIDNNDSNVRNSSFFKDYVSEFNEEPSLVEMQVFESSKILKSLLSSGSTSRDSVASRLRSLGRSEGVTGELRMSNSRELERPLHILSLDSGLIKKVD